jgi:RluA family pseudouridine synthase
MRRNARPDPLPLARGLAIIYEDRDLLVVDKPAGLLSVGIEAGKSLTAHSILTNYVRKGSNRSWNRVFVVHRLDRDTSGVLIFAKNEEAKLQLQKHWDEIHKTYLAVVHGKCPKKSDTISTYLAENRAQVVYSTSDPAQGKLSHTAYRVRHQTKYYTLLEVDLLTGRKNQIRVHLSGIGHPIVGDRKYGRTGDNHPHLALHAETIVFNHPTNGKPLTISAKVPGYFFKLVGIFDHKNDNEEHSIHPSR